MNEVCLSIEVESDIAQAARSSKQVALAVGFSESESYYVATAASELAANTLFHGGGGTFEVRGLTPRPGVELVATDHGPGIADLDLAMREGYSTSDSLGCGLPGARRLMDELNITSQPGEGTAVVARKWYKKCDNGQR